MKLSRRLHHQLENFFREFFADENLRLPEIEIYCSRGAKLVTKIISVHGITLGRFVFIKPELMRRNETNQLFVTKNLLAHETTHVLQYQKLGTVRFLWRYFKSYCINLRGKKTKNLNARHQAYLEIPFEIEARMAGAEFVEWLNKM